MKLTRTNMIVRIFIFIYEKKNTKLIIYTHNTLPFIYLFIIILLFML